MKTVFFSKNLLKIILVWQNLSYMTSIYLLICMYQLYQKHRYYKTIDYASELQIT